MSTLYRYGFGAVQVQKWSSFLAGTKLYLIADTKLYRITVSSVNAWLIRNTFVSDQKMIWYSVNATSMKEVTSLLSMYQSISDCITPSTNQSKSQLLNSMINQPMGQSIESKGECLGMFCSTAKSSISPSRFVLMHKKSNVINPIDDVLGWVQQ